jgi:hypothetical protein
LAGAGLPAAILAVLVAGLAGTDFAGAELAGGGSEAGKTEAGRTVNPWRYASAMEVTVWT